MNRHAVALGAVALFSATSHAQANARPEDAARDVVIRFERALQDHDVPGIAALVADDIVVFENGHRNDGWQDFRDNHLVPEMKEPKHPAKSTPVKLRATPQLAWGYTRTELFADPEAQNGHAHPMVRVHPRAKTGALENRFARLEHRQAEVNCSAEVA